MLNTAYVQAAIRTESPYDNFAKGTANPKIVKNLFMLIQGMTFTADRLDMWKKYLFYGKVPIGGEAVLMSFPDKASPEQMARLEDLQVRRLLHGAIGLATEAGEMLEAIMKHVEQGAPLDPVNIAEEVGDGFWYDALILDAIQTDPELVARRNIAKLFARYPNAFDPTNAIIRDLVAERAVLEGVTERAKESFERSNDLPDGEE